MKRTVLFLAALAAIARPALAGSYTIVPGGENAVRFRSEAPLESFEGKTDRAAGTILVDPDDLTAPIDVYVVVDLASLDTGIALRNRHMRENHLHTDRFPEAVFTASRVDSAPAGMLPPGASVRCVVAGNFALHGVTKPLTVPVSIVRRPDGALEVDARFEVDLSDFEIPRPKFLLLKLDEVQHVTIHLVALPEAERQ